MNLESIEKYDNESYIFRYCTSKGNLYNIRIPFSGISKHFYFLLYISLYHFFALALWKGYRRGFFHNNKMRG